MPGSLPFIIEQGDKLIEEARRHVCIRKRKVSKSCHSRLHDANQLWNARLGQELSVHLPTNSDAG